MSEDKFNYTTKNFPAFPLTEFFSDDRYPNDGRYSKGNHGTRDSATPIHVWLEERADGSIDFRANGWYICRLLTDGTLKLHLHLPEDRDMRVAMTENDQSNCIIIRK